MLEVRNLKKIYKLSRKQMAIEKKKDKYKNAIDNINFIAENNKIFGLLGPNGAGKTTILRCISTLIKPTEGEIYLDEYDIENHGQEFRKNICFLTNELKLDEHFTPNYTISFFGKLYGMSGEELKNRRNYLFEKFGIDKFSEVKIGELSTGMKQKLSIAVSLIHNPEVIIFDEPTNGLDIITARVVTDYLLELKNQGKCVIISTHIMEVAEKLCDGIAILLNGKIVIQGTLKYILSETNSDNLENAFFKLYSEKIGELI